MLKPTASAACDGIGMPPDTPAPDKHATHAHAGGGGGGGRGKWGPRLLAAAWQRRNVRKLCMQPRRDACMHARARRSRREALERAQAHAAAGNMAAATECYQRAVSITHSMTKVVIEVGSRPKGHSQLGGEGGQGPDAGMDGMPTEMPYVCRCGRMQALHSACILHCPCLPLLAHEFVRAPAERASLARSHWGCTLHFARRPCASAPAPACAAWWRPTRQTLRWRRWRCAGTWKWSSQRTATCWRMAARG